MQKCNFCLILILFFMVAKLALKKQLLNLQDLWRTSSYVPRCHTVKYLNNSCPLSSKTHAGHHGTSFLELTEPLLRNPPQGQPWWRSLKTPVWVPPRLRTLEPFHPPALGSGFSQSRRAKYQRYWGIENIDLMTYLGVHLGVFF